MICNEFSHNEMVTWVLSPSNSLVAVVRCALSEGHFPPYHSRGGVRAAAMSVYCFIDLACIDAVHGG